MTNAYSPEKNIVTKNSSSITQNTITELNTVLSKTCKSILLALYQTPGIQQKALAASINTSASSLSNILVKLEAVRPQLLDIEVSGRSKHYSLTKIAEQYVAKCLIPKEAYNINTFFAVSTNNSLVNDTLSILYQFQGMAGSEWLLILDDMLSNGKNTDEDKSELSILYTQFINNMNQMYMQQEAISIRKIYDELDNSILIKRLDNYLKNNLKDQHALIPLFDLEKQNPQKAVQLINYAFAEMKPQVFGLDELSLFPNELPVLREQYHAIFHKLSTMANEFASHYKNKMQALKDWESTFYISNISLNYIAEKCNTIYLVESRKLG